jgi:plasmid stabilization system protein ParE
MSRQLSFNALAAQELREATTFYSKESPALGQAFLEEVARALNQLREFPHSCPLLSRTVRKKVLRRFPYNVLYSVRSEEIRILAIAHQKRRPFYWRDRK